MQLMCIHCDYEKYHVCVCSDDLASSRESVALAHMPCRAASSAHAREHMCVHRDIIPYTRADAHERSTHIYVCLIRACLSIQAGTHTHTHTMSPGTSSARAVARTCTWTRCSHMHAHSLFITQASIYLQRSDPSIATYRYTNLYTHMARSTRARARSHAQAFVATHLYVLHVTTGDAYKDDDLCIHAFAYIYIGHGGSSWS